MKKRLVAISAALVGSVAGTAHAELNLSLTGVLFDAPDYIWSYRVTLEPSTSLRTNATVTVNTAFPNGFVTLYDIQGFINGTASFSPAPISPAVATITGAYTFAVASSQLGQTPALTLPDDLRQITNLTLSIANAVGSSGPASITPTGVAAVDLGTLSFRSRYGNRAFGVSDFASQTTKTSNSTTLNAIGSVQTPAIPEPSSAALVLPAAAVLGLRRRRRA